MNTPKNATNILACILFGALGFLGNWFNLPLFFNVDFLFGSFFTMFSILALGGIYGAIAGTVAGTCTYLVWNHPWSIVIFAAEAIFVGVLYSKRKGSLVIYDIFYWICVGIPLIYLFHHFFMGIQVQSTFVIMLKQPVNGVFNALTASLAFLLFKFIRKPLGIHIAFHQALFVVMASLVLLPSIFLLATGVKGYETKITELLKIRVSVVSKASRKILTDWVHENHRNVQILSTLVGNPNINSYDNMQHYVRIMKAATPPFKGMGVFNKDAVTVSYAPLEQDGKSNIGVDFSYRPHVAILKRDKRAYISDVMISGLGNPSPIVLLLAPIVISGEYKGYCSGVIETSFIADLLQNLSEKGINITLCDGHDRVIVSTIGDLKTMDPFPRPYAQSGESADTEPRLWKSAPQTNISYMQQWRDAYYFRIDPLADTSSWKIIVEASCIPLIEDISHYSITRLGLLALLIVFSVLLAHLIGNGFISNILKLQVLTRSLPARIDNAADIKWPNSRIMEMDELSINIKEVALILQKDVSERKMVEDALRQSLAEKVALLKEVHHRVKNNLQIVASLLGLQAGRSKNSHVIDALKETRNRVRSISMLHETLYRSENLANINFQNYLRDLCSQLLSAFGPLAGRVKLDLKVAQIGFPLDHAVPCGLIVNELVSNALKHAFPDNRNGKITVGLDILKEDTLVLSVRDNGVGLPSGHEEVEPSTLGLQLVSALARQLNGSVEMESSPDCGCTFSIIFPVPEN